MTYHRNPSLRRGVTLTELMIGMLIGLLAVLIISQVLMVSEGQKRTTASGADAQVSGALALYTMQRDVQAAGYGFSSSPALVGCPISAQYNGVRPTDFAATLAPVVITTQATRGVGAIGDSIRLLASSKTSYTVPTRVTPMFNLNAQAFNVSSTLGFAPGDLGLVAAADATQPCWVFQVTSAPAATVVPRIDQPTKWNSAGTPTLAYNDGSILVNLGTLIDNRYEINLVNDVPTLQVSSFDVNNPSVRIVRNIQSDLVGLRAFYGHDTTATANGSVDQYDTATPADNAGWLRVLSVRLIVVARSGQYEKEIVTFENPRWDVGTNPPTTGATTCGSSQCVRLDVGAGNTRDDTVDVPAKHYRYKVFETIVPVRNLLWSS